MEQATEQVSSMHVVPAVLADEGRSGAGVRRLKLERPVCSVPVVVLDVDTEDLLQGASPNDQQPIQDSVRTVRIHRSA